MTLEHIKRISIRGYLGARGIKPQSERAGRAMYLSPLREERTASFSVNYHENVWYDHGIGAGGSIIDLVARMEGCSVGEAIRRLENETFGSGSAGIGVGALSFSSHRDTPVSARQTAPEKPSIEIVSVEELKHPALVEYLSSRGIDPTMAQEYCNEVRYRIGGREYFAIGFRNDAGGWELRNRNFKGSSTPKNITTINNDSDTVMVFEGFIDFLSYLSLKQNPSPTIDIAVLNSVANLRQAIPFLESHRTIHAFLDNDEAGRKALDSLRESLPGSEVVDQSPFYRNHKDLNDYWREQSADII
jgi:DNA primase